MKLTKNNLLTSIALLGLITHQASAREQFCPSHSYCDQVQSVKLTDHGYVICNADQEGAEFDCTKLFKQSNGSILRMPVRVHQDGVDACHIPGGCGSHGCVLGYGVATFDANCTEH